MHTTSHDLQKSENWHVALSTASNTLLVKPRDFRTFAAVCTVFSQYVCGGNTNIWWGLVCGACSESNVHRKTEN